MSEKLKKKIENSEEKSFEEKRFGSKGLELKNKLSELVEKTDITTYASLQEEGKRLKDKYGEDVTNYIAWHILIGSTPKEGRIESEETKFDFEGDDSIKRLINKKLKEVKSKED